jgi:protein TonB
VGGTGSGGEEPLRVGGDVKAPVLSHRVEPQYPEAARKARMEGVVILEAIITAEGNVEDVRVLKSVNPLLDASAVRAVGQWKYKSATLNGRAVRVYLTVTVTFRLN